MKTKNKVFIGSGVLFLIILIAGYGFVSACGPWSNSGGWFHSRFHERGFHKGFYRKDISDFILWRLDRKAEELKLTEPQKAKFEVLKGNLKAHFSEHINDHKKMMGQFHAEMSKKDPDVTHLVESIKTKIDEMSGFVNENLDLLMVFYDSLDSMQKRIITDEIKERMECRRLRP